MILTAQESLVLEEIDVPGYEKVVKVTDEKVGLRAIICLHDTTLGPALGGTRIYPYLSFEAALNDAMRLAQGMTVKSALAGTGWGGGKAVIIVDQREKTEELLLSFGRAVHQLGGEFITAEDLGCTTDDVDVMSRETPYLVGLSHEKSSGNPGVFTAWGVFRGIQSVLKKLYGNESVHHRSVAIQGLGCVGKVLLEHLFWAGAKLTISDIDMEKAKRLAKTYGAELCPPEEILQVECDVLSPCALGGILNVQTIPHLRCRAIAGAANNQLLLSTDAEEIMKRRILYAPDFVINAGGLINVTCEFDPQGYHPACAREKVHNIYDRLLLIYDIAEQNKISTHASAVAFADYQLKYKISKRHHPPHFHHHSKT
jgi:leucine dehydrogenase